MHSLALNSSSVLETPRFLSAALPSSEFRSSRMPPSKHLEPEMSNVQSGASILEVKAKPQKPGALPFFGLQNLSASPTDTASKTLTPVHSSASAQAASPYPLLPTRESQGPFRNAKQIIKRLG